GRYRDANMDTIHAQAVYGPGSALLGEVATFAVILFGGWRVLNGHMELGVLVSFILFVGRLFHPIQELSQVYNIFQAAAAALEKLSGVLAEKPSVPEPAPDDAVTRDAWRGEMSFQNITFGYRDRNILEN